MKALIVDDSRAVRVLMRRMMTSLGAEVSEAADGLEAITALRDGLTAEVALVDWNMPNIDGLELVKLIRKDLRDSDMTIMMVTSESDPKQITRALMAGADEYLVKPINVEMLREKLEILGVLPEPVDASGSAS